MTTLVTGGSGFVGLNVVEALAAHGRSVVLFDQQPPPPAAVRALDALPGRRSVVIGDVRDAAAIGTAIRDHGVDAIVHAAAVTADSTREAREPRKVLSVNVDGTLAVLEAARATSRIRIVVVGSGAAYGRAHDVGAPLVEGVSPSDPEDLYGLSKLVAEKSALRLAKLWRSDVVCVRLGSVCGPWEFNTGVRDLLSPHLQAARLAVRGETAILPRIEPWRDWIYSRDIGAGIVALLDAQQASLPMYHLASGIDWRDSFHAWCRALQGRFPRFEWGVADADGAPNVSFVIDRDRAPMSVAAILRDTAFTVRFGPQDAFADYATWIVEHRDFVAA